VLEWLTKQVLYKKGEKMSKIALILLLCTTCLAEREGFYAQVSGSGQEVIRAFVIPSGHEFILLQVASESDGYEVRPSSSPYISAAAVGRKHDFPDRCVVWGPGEEIDVYVNSSSPIIIVGYFMDYCPRADVTGDCKVNLDDLAVLAAEWMMQ
jgi:hypothetical protein